MRPLVRQRRSFIAVIVGLVLSALLGGWVHAAVHVGDAEALAGCTSCQWAKHSPVAVASGAAFVPALDAAPAEHVAPPLHAPRRAVAAPNGRAPPLAA